MRSVTLRLEDLRTTILNLGFVGENEHKQFRFDSKKMFDEYPDAAASLTVVPPAGEAYPAVIERDGDYVIWTITDSNLTAEGDGEIQLAFTSGETVAKTYIGRTRTCRALVPTGEIPDGLDDFLTRAGAILDEVEDVVPAGGTTGQVLAKKSNTDYDTEWVDQTGGGGGGTSDYTELTNKPQIAGVTLSGNKTLHDLGAATEEAVNAKYTRPASGIPSTDLADGVIPDVSGFYTKPEGGIPASDIASGVIPDPTSIIDDTAGDGDTNKTWSADKLADVKSDLSVLQPDASASDVGKMLKVKTVSNGKVTEYEFGEGGGGSIDPSVIEEAVSDWLDEHPEATTTVEDGSITRAKLADTLKADTDAVGADFVDHGLAQYFYKADTYINANGNETTISGYDLYKIPVSFGDFIQVKQTSGENSFWGSLNKVYAFKCIYNNAYTSIGVDSVGNFTFYSTARDMTGFTKSGYSAIMVCCQNGQEGNVSVYHNSKDTIAFSNSLVAERNSFPHTLDTSNCVVSPTYVDNGANVVATPTGYKVMVHTVKANDRVYFGSSYGLNNYATFTAKDDFASANISRNPFVAPEDGFICIFINESNVIPVTIAPNRMKVDYSQLSNVPDSPFSGMSAVAFGTSLTYRSQTTTGYLVYLPELSGITFDNQGVGSAVILGDGGSLDMLAKIKGYSSYSGKKVCTIEGFCNDWYQNKTLGTWKDTGETTVCGCVRSAINYILSQNANLTVFLILDPYGRNYGGVDVSTTAQNASNLTQFEYYEEIAKVANSLGIPVIKQYAESQISENTPQYISDDIHPTAKGALQSANFIWSKMKQYYPNNVSE